MHIQFLGAIQEVTGSKYLIQGKAAGIGPIGLTALELAQRLAKEIRCLINQS
jgi:hypothetical protein